MILTPEEQENIRKTIVEKVPEEFGITGRLWTLGRTREYIQKEFHKTINERTLSDYMKRWGMSCQRPVKRAKAENAIIYWADETGVSNCDIVERSFSPKGRPPVLPVETKRQRVNMISAISSQGSVRFMVYQDTMNQQRLIRFMERLMRTSEQNVFLILDIISELKARK